MKKLILLLALMATLISCGYEIRLKDEPEEPKLTKEQEYQQKLKNYKVVLLFEYDGTKVYRFYDPDTYQCVYFTNTNGKTSYEYIQKTGKYTSTKYEVQSINNKETK